MNFQDIHDVFRGRRPRALSVRSVFSVMLTLIEIDGELHVVFEKRADTLKTQPNEVSFPGGAIEEGETPRQAAIRETMEELGVPEENIRVLYESDYSITRHGTIIHCFIGQLHNISMEELDPNPHEVGFIFTVPLSFFLEEQPRKYTIDFVSQYSEDFPYELIPGGKDYNFVKIVDTIYFYIYHERIIWGFTARMMYAFVRILKGLG